MPETKSGTNLPKNTAAALCYAAGWVSGLIFLLIKKEEHYANNNRDY